MVLSQVKSTAPPPTNTDSADRRARMPVARKNRLIIPIMPNMNISSSGATSCPGDGKNGKRKLKI